jgi:hypothetical protein
MVTQRGNKDLGLVLETAESLGVNDAVAVPLKICAYWARFLPFESASAKPAFCRVWGKAVFRFLYPLPNIQIDHQNLSFTSLLRYNPMTG